MPKCVTEVIEKSLELLLLWEKRNTMSHTPWLKNHPGIDNYTLPNLKELIAESGKTCVSIVVPTHRLGQDRQADRKVVEDAVQIAKEAVLHFPKDYTSGIDYLVDQIDFNKNKEGIGIFVSPGIRTLIHFPFPVTKRIVINKFFHLPDIIYTENYSTDYYLLEISKKEMHLFHGVLDHLEEIHDENFPKKISDHYEYSKPAPSNSGAGYAHVKSVEKDRSELEHIRLTNVFRQADKSLAEYVTEKTPLILCGPERNISLYTAITRYESSIISSMGDNYRGTHLHDLELQAWLQMKSYVEKQKLALIDEFREKMGMGLAVYGVEDVKKAASEGKGLKLMVEKDFEGRGSGDRQKNERYSDIVNEIVTTVIEKNGQVTIMEKDSLLAYKRIALITRY